MSAPTLKLDRAKKEREIQQAVTILGWLKLSIKEHMLIGVRSDGTVMAVDYEEEHDWIQRSFLPTVFCRFHIDHFLVSIKLMLTSSIIRTGSCVLSRCSQMASVLRRLVPLVPGSENWLFFAIRTLKTPTVPPDYSHIELPERRRLPFYAKVPQFPPNVRPLKWERKLTYMRGPEPYHNFLIHKQFGVQALRGGELKFGHFEMMRMTVLRKFDESRMFAQYRVDAPWKSHTSKGTKRLGGGKGNIHHYTTPVKAGRVILEIGGKCEFSEVKGFLSEIAHNLPFAARVVSQEILDEDARKEAWDVAHNENVFSFEHIVRNNMLGCHSWISPYDTKWFGKYR